MLDTDRVENANSQLDYFIEQVENDVDYHNFDEAEKRRLEFKKGTKEIAQQLEIFNDDLTELVIKFANIAKVPITLR